MHKNPRVLYLHNVKRYRHRALGVKADRLDRKSADTIGQKSGDPRAQKHTDVVSGRSEEREVSLLAYQIPFGYDAALRFVFRHETIFAGAGRENQRRRRDG